jgi:hypothetical protein
MRTLFFTLLLLAGFVACKEKKQEGLSANELIMAPSNGDKVPVLVFTDSVYDFGAVAAGSMVKHSFEFVNKGKGQLIITNAQASCGCTVPTFPHEPIPPGGKGKIDVEFNSTGRSGKQNKTVTIFANSTPPTHELLLKGNVSPDPAELNGPVN